jgi:hypothetical protein
MRLSIGGPPVVEPSDRVTNKLIKNAFGMDINSSLIKRKILKKGGENEKHYVGQSSFRINLKWLWMIFQSWRRMP